MKYRKYGILIIFVVFVLVGGISYSFFNYVKTGNNNVLINGSLYLTLVDGNDTINLTNIYPMSKEKARERNDNIITFKVQGLNTLEEDIYYEILVNNGDEEDGLERLNPEDLMFDLIEIDENNNEVYRVNAKSVSTLNKTSLWSDIVAGETNSEIERTYKIRMWVKEDVLISDTDPLRDYTATSVNGSVPFKDHYASVKVAVMGGISHSVYLNKVQYLSNENSGVSNSSNIDDNKITLKTTLPSINSTVTYNVTVANNTNIAEVINTPTVVSNSNSDVTYEIEDLENTTIMPRGSKTFKIKVKYNTETLPSDTTDELVLGYTFSQSTQGSSDNPIQINYIEDLVDLAVSVNSGTTYSGKYIKMMRDLDFNDDDSYRDPTDTTTYGDYTDNGVVNDIKTELTSEYGWTKIGYNSSNTFQGTFDGGNNTLSNLYINRSTGVAQGFFGRIQNATIANLKINGNVNASYSTGGIAAASYGTSYINNCVTNVNTTNTTSSNESGGFVANDAGILTINNSVNHGTVRGGNNAGGFVGYIGTGRTLTINNSYNDGEIIQSNGNHAGGLVGRDNAATSTININNSYNKGNVTLDVDDISQGRYIGGLVGLVNGVINIDSSYNEGKVESVVNTITTGLPGNGGLIGMVYTGGEAVILDSYNKGLVTGGVKTGGLIGYAYGANKVLINSSYNMGEINSTRKTASIAGDAGGLIGIIYNTNSASVLNSYNSGKVTGLTLASGIVGRDSASSNMFIINSYNTGNIVAIEEVASGITRMDGSRYNSYVNNVYNFGSLTSASSSDSRGITYDVAYSGSGYTTTVNNAYYLNTAPSGSNDYENYTTSMTQVNMKTSTFVNTLNTNKSSINLSSISNNLSGYTLSNWKLGSGNIPTFDW